MTHRTIQSPAVEACIACAKQCEHCGTICIEEKRIHCAKVCRDCAQVCWLTSSFLSRNGTGVAEVCELCVDLCDMCATECEQHDNDHCRETAKIARACEAACSKIAETTPRTPAGEAL